MSPLDIANAFVDRINAHDVGEIARLMTDDHRFVDSLGDGVTGREATRNGWTGYFTMAPDYKLTIEKRIVDGSTVILLGTAGGTFRRDGTSLGRWSTPVALRAVVEGDRVAVWQVYADNEPMRKLMRD